MIRFVSQQSDYDFYVSTDPAFVQRPEDPEALADYEAKLKAARKTGDYSALRTGEGEPTKFILGQVHRPTFREVLDRVRLPQDNPRRISDMTLEAVMFRLAIRAIPSLEKKFEYRRDKDWDNWSMAPAELVDQMDRTHPAIVGEIGWYVYLKTMEIDPLS